MNVFEEAFDFYEKFITGENPTRSEQLAEITNILSDIFPFDVVNCTETGVSSTKIDGMCGVYFNYLSQKTNGIFYDVDISAHIINIAEQEFSKIEYGDRVKMVCDDSVNFLKTTDFVPNLIHLDSHDLDLRNPFPSMLHGWMEFEAIKDKMLPGSIIIVDDNYFMGTYVDWISIDINTREELSSDRIDITQPILGKGSHIYQWAERDDTDWKVIEIMKKHGNHKIVVQKI